MDNGSHKVIFIIIGLVVVGAILYFVMTGGGEPTGDETLSIDSVNVANAEVGDDVLILLGQIKTLSIDKKFFQTPAFTSLIDYTIAIPAQNIGRSNPFASFGSVAPKVATTTTKTTNSTH